MDIKYIGNIGPAAGEGGGGGSSFDPTAIEGYDATKKQELFNENGTLKWKTEVPYYTDFTAYRKLIATSASPSSFTTAKVFLHIKAGKVEYPREGQVLFTEASNAFNFGFTGTNYIALFNGSNNERGSYELTSDLKDYWIKIDITSSTNAAVYYIVDGNYTYDTLPSDNSQWTAGPTISNFNIANKTFLLGDWGGNAGISYQPEAISLYDAKFLFDDVLTFDLWDGTSFKLGGNLTLQKEYI